MNTTSVVLLNETALSTPGSPNHLYLVFRDQVPVYLAFHDGTTWQKVLTTPINDQGKMTNTYLDGKPKLT